MSDTSDSFSEPVLDAADGAFVQALLEGGPADFPADLRTQTAAAGQDRIKITYCGGHEHFDRCAGNVSPVIFRWTGRTRIAE
ncbi:DUF5988 family protein [Micromonospora sp. NPDC048839]|uniref:DUF5988 family protein n=1 Tax=Micromonospora sp. NPDC048839 TaxID=3155641 RepID=UPI0033E90F4E